MNDMVLSQATMDILLERRRQIEAEGFDVRHDDAQDTGSMARAAAAYIMNQFIRPGCPVWWPWDITWWKPKNRRRDLVRAAALIIAELEKLDRKR